MAQGEGAGPCRGGAEGGAGAALTGAAPDLPPDWLEALAAAERAARVAVVGPTDVGKSTFIHALSARTPERSLIDLDPGQKMLGPPGTAALGRVLPERRLDRFVFLGSTAVGSFRALAQAAARLAAGAGPGFIVNTSGYVQGPGARMQAMVLDALAPDLVVALGLPSAFDPVLAPWSMVRLERSPHARRKSPSARAAIRQSAFAEAMAGAVELEAAVPIEPGPPLPFEGAARPVCALTDADGEDMRIGVLTALDPPAVFAPPPPRPVARLLLGKMWAEPAGGGWKLIERLAPAFSGGSGGG